MVRSLHPVIEKGEPNHHVAAIAAGVRPGLWPFPQSGHFTGGQVHFGGGICDFGGNLLIWHTVNR